MCSTVLNTNNYNNNNVSLTANQNIIMIFEGSYDNEDWSNDAENVAFTGIKYILKYSNKKQLFKIVKQFNNIVVSQYRCQINARLVSRREF